MCSEPLPLMSVPEVAARLNVSQKTTWRYLSSGKFTKVKVGARTLVTPESVDAFIAQGGAR